MTFGDMDLGLMMPSKPIKLQPRSNMTHGKWVQDHLGHHGDFHPGALPAAQAMGSSSNTKNPGRHGSFKNGSVAGLVMARMAVGRGISAFIIGASDDNNHMDETTPVKKAPAPVEKVVAEDHQHNQKWHQPSTPHGLAANTLLEEDHLRMLLGKVDSDLMSKIRAAALALEALFKDVDTDHDGLLTYFEVKALSRRVGHGMVDEVDKHVPEEERTSEPLIGHAKFIEILLPLVLAVPSEFALARIPTVGMTPKDRNSMAAARKGANLFHAPPEPGGGRRASVSARKHQEGDHDHSHGHGHGHGQGHHGHDDGHGHGDDHGHHHHGAFHPHTFAHGRLRSLHAPSSKHEEHKHLDNMLVQTGQRRSSVAIMGHGLGVPHHHPEFGVQGHHAFDDHHGNHWYHGQQGHHGQHDHHGHHGRQAHHGHQGHHGHQTHHGQHGHHGQHDHNGYHGRQSHHGHQGHHGQHGHHGQNDHQGHSARQSLHANRDAHHGQNGLPMLVHNGHSVQYDNHGHHGHHDSQGHHGQHGHNGQHDHQGHNGQQSQHGQHGGHHGVDDHSGQHRPALPSEQHHRGRFSADEGGLPLMEAMGRRKSHHATRTRISVDTIREDGPLSPRTLASVLGPSSPSSGSPKNVHHHE